jgi:hypothetical protein
MVGRFLTMKARAADLSLVAECWSARMMVSRQEARVTDRASAASHSDFRSARSYLEVRVRVRV